MKKTLFLALFPLVGCATMIKGSSQQVRVVTNPPGAMLYVDNQPVGPSPQTLTLKHTEHQISAALPGMQGYARLSTGFSGWSLLFFPVGTIIDAVSGAITTLDQDSIQIALVPDRTASPPSGYAPAPAYAPPPPPAPPPPR